MRICWGRRRWSSGDADGIVEPQHAFGDIDRAMEFAEDTLLNEAFREVGPLLEIAVAEIGLLDGFTPGEIAAITARLRRTVYPKGITVFEQGAPGHEIFFIARGLASVRLKNGARDIRLVTFTAGTVFGELALLDKGARSKGGVMGGDAFTAKATSNARPGGITPSLRSCQIFNA
jgi:hypothetical protein